MTLKIVSKRVGTATGQPWVNRSEITGIVPLRTLGTSLAALAASGMALKIALEKVGTATGMI